MQKKKSLGQHFLHSKSYLDAVADAAHIKEGEVVLEIGPGEGALTEILLERGASVLAIEKDSRLIPLLREKFAGKDFEVIEGDALELPEDRPLAPWFKDGPQSSYKVVGNIPYYITGALFKKFLTSAHQPSTLVFLVQKEVAERIVSRSVAWRQKESILSLSVKAYGAPKYIKTVPAGAFSPPPKVDSAILAVESISRKNFENAAHEKKFFELVKKGFSKKRKLLKNNLGPDYASVLQKTAIEDKARAEDVSLQKWLELSSD